ncbi:MAG: hypothetical protein LRZ84_14275 [Desertifilum sp.]|nr:hypothetical protein [Desertifilum sp.]
MSEPRKRGRPNQGKQRKAVWFDPDVWELIKDIPRIERGRVLNQIIRENVRRYRR